MPVASMERISIILLEKIQHFFVMGASSPFNGNHFLVISPIFNCTHLRVSRSLRSLAKYILYVCLSWAKMRTQNYVAKHAHAQSQFGAVKTDL